LRNNTVYLEIGGNIENRLEYLSKTKKLINKNIGEITNESSIYQSPPWGFAAENHFLNQCIEIKTTLTPEELIIEALEIEKKLGRIRGSNQYESRTVDIDILFYEKLKIKNALLEVPHPRMHLRKFVLMPLSEIAPNFTHPVLNHTIATLLESCQDQSICTKIA
jgi:2-amino-4-hydroxy-6-hydroxymethyldihydropteridine diphosphokinase